MIPRIDIDAGDTSRFLGRAASQAGNLRSLFGDVADDFHARQAEVFASEGRSQGTPWAPLKPKYLSWRQRNNRGTQIMRLAGGRGGLLYASLTRRGGPQQVRQVGSDEVRVGTRVGIADAHQRGLRNLPARPLVNIDRQTSERWVRMLGAYLLED